VLGRGFYAIGFREDGTAFIDKPALNMKVQIGTETYRLGGINKMRCDGDYFLFNSDFSYTTKNSSPGRDVIAGIEPNADGTVPDLTMNCAMTLKVEQIVSSQSALNLPEGKVVLSLSEKADPWRQYGIDHLTVGDTITLEVSSDSKWNEAESAVGSYIKIVSDGVVNAAGAVAGTHPRSAVGIKADGSLLLYTVDGRLSGYSAGFTAEEVGNRLLELGCVDALLLDGGGSTNLNARYIGDNQLTQVNRPSEGERSVTNYIMLAAKGPGSGTMQNFGILPGDALVLCGSSVDFRAGASDETGRAADISGEISWNASGALGKITGDGQYTAGRTGGDALITATSGAFTAQATVTVVETPSSISVFDEDTGRKVESLRLTGGQSAALTAAAVYRHMDVICADTAFTWSVLGEIGSVDQTGLFTAGTKEGTGRITVTAGDAQVSLDVTIKTDNELLEGFENDALLVGGTTGVTVSGEKNKDFVKIGNRSGRIDYTLSGTAALLPAPLSVGDKMRFLSLWVYGNRSGIQLTAELAGGEQVEIGAVDFDGWRQYVIKLPGSGTDLVGIRMSGSGSGAIFLDHLMASSSEEPDLAPPVIELSVENGSVRGFIEDAVNDYPPASRIELFYDGKPLSFQYSSGTGKLTAQLPMTQPDCAEGIHKVTLRNWDKSGNIADKSVTIGTKSATVFTDMEDHWSSEYVDYLFGMGIVTGIETAQGLAYQPEAPMTREQFAVVICRWLGLDLAVYEQTPLPYADADSIAPYALPSVKAACALGIIKGNESGDTVIFDPSSALTRAQAMTIIGRIQRCGYPESDLTAFRDAAQVPSWSLRYVRSLVSQSVISGNGDGSLDPGGLLTRAQVAKILTAIT
jgi:hypothetical protein